MGFWLFLTLAVLGNYLFKAYKLRVHSRYAKVADARIIALELELKDVREKIQHLDEAVFFDDFDLKRKFTNLKRELE